MQKNGYRESTIRGTIQALKAIANRCNLLEPELAKGCLAKAECSINRKGKICEDLDRFYRYKKISWVKPHYDRIDVLPFVPTTQEVNDLIACVGPKMSVFTLLLKETGCRFNEGYNLERGQPRFQTSLAPVHVTTTVGASSISQETLT